MENPETSETDVLPSALETAPETYENEKNHNFTMLK
jgi:hypothetical protein